MNGKDVISPEIEIAKGTMSFNNTLIQICNISKVSIEPKEKMKIPMWVMLGIIACLVITGLGNMYGIVGMVLFLIPIIAIYISNSNLVDYIVLSLNSGERIYLTCNNYGFLNKAVQKIIESIKEGKTAVINLNNCTIKDSLISGRDSIKGDLVKGDKIKGDKSGRDKITLDNNSSLTKGDDLNIVVNNEDWEKLELFFEKLIGKYDDENKNNGIILANEFCKQKSARKLSELLRKNKTIFEDILGNVASAGILGIIKCITGIWFR